MSACKAVSSSALAFVGTRARHVQLIHCPVIGTLVCNVSKPCCIAKHLHKADGEILMKKPDELIQQMVCHLRQDLIHINYQPAIYGMPDHCMCCFRVHDPMYA